MNPKTADAVLRRSDGKCEGCGRPGLDLVLHHRQLRSGGGKDTEINLLALHPMCHLWAHSNPELARGYGWIVSRYVEPGSVPVRVLVPWGGDPV